MNGSVKEEEESKELKAEQGTTAASKERVLYPKRTKKLWRIDKASKDNPGEILESPI